MSKRYYSSARPEQLIENGEALVGVCLWETQPKRRAAAKYLKEALTSHALGFGALQQFGVPESVITMIGQLAAYQPAPDFTAHPLKGSAPHGRRKWATVIGSAKLRGL